MSQPATGLSICRLIKEMGHNIDDQSTGHISAAVQNILLIYGDPDADFGISALEVISELATRLRNVTDVTGTTHSAVWCPLIWKALYYCNEAYTQNKGSDNPVPELWTRIDLGADTEKYDRFNEFVRSIFEKYPGWCEYAREVLKTDFSNVPLWNEDRSMNFDEIERQAKTIKQRIEQMNLFKHHPVEK